jgi:hypothetical protein
MNAVIVFDHPTQGTQTLELPPIPCADELALAWQQIVEYAGAIPARVVPARPKNPRRFGVNLIQHVIHFSVAQIDVEADDERAAGLKALKLARERYLFRYVDPCDGHPNGCDIEVHSEGRPTCSWHEDN